MVETVLEIQAEKETKDDTAETKEAEEEEDSEDVMEVDEEGLGDMIGAAVAEAVAETA
jgi:hypothetical protein